MKSQKGIPHYWVVKGRRSDNDWEKMLVPQRTGTWHTGKPPSRLWRPHDRIFFWESNPGRRILGLGELLTTDEGRDDNGDTLYRVKYLTAALESPLGIAELRGVAVVREASFLKAGPAGSVFRLSPIQAEMLFSLVAARNPETRHVWPDIAVSELVDPVPDIDAIFLSGREGTAKRVEHLVRERNAKLVRTKKKATLRRTGTLRCEVCAFDFARTFGALGSGLCEVHHRVALASLDGETETTLEDLAILCSNCHRVIHRSDPMLTVEALREVLRANTILASEGSAT